MSTSRGIVFKYNSWKPGAFVKDWKNLAATAFNQGLLLYVIADEVAAVNTIHRSIKLSDLTINDAAIRHQPPLYEVAEAFARHDSGREANVTLEISPVSKKILELDDPRRSLLQRAFNDCRSILLDPLTGGWSAKVFSVHAVFKDSRVGPRPLPFFAKIDSRNRINQEIKNYKEFTAHFIPFNLRPNLDETRCFCGAAEGILVGNFVEQSESLRDVAIRGAAQPAIHSLFDNTLRGWRQQASKREKIIAEALSGVFVPSRVTKPRFEMARKLGASKRPDELLAIAENFPVQGYLEAPIHADLHCFNVRVSGFDAILIDFALTRAGALVADPASLEISLAFERTGNEDDNASWMKTVDTLYSEAFLERAPPPANEPRPREWLWTVIRQIRLIALADQVSDGEYAIAVALYLLRLTTFSAKTPEEEFRNAYAYVLAERIITSRMSR